MCGENEPESVRFRDGGRQPGAGRVRLPDHGWPEKPDAHHTERTGVHGQTAVRRQSRNREPRAGVQLGAVDALGQGGRPQVLHWHETRRTRGLRQPWPGGLQARDGTTAQDQDTVAAEHRGRGKRLRISQGILIASNWSASSNRSRR